MPRGAPAQIEYLDFDLAIEPSDGAFVARVLNSPAGPASGTFSMPFTDLEIENFLLRFGRSRQTVRRLESQETKAAKRFGGQLFTAVFADSVQRCLRNSLDEASRRRTGLRIRLRLGSVPALADLPWEFLYNAELNRFLGLSIETPVVRFLELPEAIRPLSLDLPLRVLMLVSAPSDYPPLDVDRESAKMHDALEHLERDGLVAIQRQKNGTLTELRRILREGEYHIFHFVGHGGFDERNQDGVLVLEGDNGRSREVSSTDLGTVLHDHRPLRLAVLNACEGARGSRLDPFAGTAQSLVQQGIPAVIAMQFEVSDEAAICFTREFYSSIADGYPVDAALAEARKAILADVNETEWATPVLYMRAPDGRVFDVGRRAGAAAGEAQPPEPVAHASVEPRPAEASALRPSDTLSFAPGIFAATDAVSCLVVAPETSPDAEATPLLQHVRRAWENHGPEIIAAADQYRAASHLPPVPRSAGAEPEFALGELSVAQAFRSEASLARAIEALCRSELAIFDLTGLEPGVLFLLGIRAVARRGVTVSSIGGAHTIGAELTLPFNLQLLNLSAHSASQEQAAEGSRPWDLLGGKIQSGYRELANLPHYLDLPAYESVRQIGIDSGAYAPIRYTDKVLVLCPFAQDYTRRNWKRFISADLPGKLSQHLRKAGLAGAAPRLERLLDRRTPRLVAQTLFESIRLTDMCLIDWTGLRPNVIFEAGVRHATNPLGAVHIVEIGDDDDTPRLPAGPKHVEDMRRLFAPVGYRCRSDDTTAYLEMIRRFEADLAANREGHTGFVYRALGQSLDRRSHPAAIPIVEELLRGANILESDDQESTGISPVLYHEVNKELVAEARAAAADRRLAAWLVMSRKEGVAGIVRDSHLADRFALLSMQVRRWARREKKQELLDEIRAYQRAVAAAARARAETAPATAFEPAGAQQEIARVNLQVKLHKEEAKALRDEGDLAGAIDTLQDVVTMLAASPFYPDLLSSSQPASPAEKILATHLADCLGMIGGNYRRLNRLDEALASFERGRTFEEADRLDLTSSYNLVNAVTLPLEMQARTAAQQHDPLRRAVAAIDRQVRGERRNDRWAWADLGQCQLLIGDLESAAKSYQRVRALGTEDALESIVAVLRRLAGALEAREPQVAAWLREGVSLVLSPS